MPSFQDQIKEGSGRASKDMRSHDGMNSKSNYLTITSKARTENPELYNTVKFLQTISKPIIIHILKSLAVKPCRYSELFISQGVKKGAFAFYLRKARKENLLILDRVSAVYKITFKGLKALEIIRCGTSIANLDMATIDEADTGIFVQLEQNKSWLEPLIRKEIRAVLSYLAKQGDNKK